MCRLLFFLILFLLILGCSPQKMIIRSTGGILDNSLKALYEENDLQLAKQAIASDLKLLDGLIKGDPENRHLLLLASQGYTSYALAFVDEEQNPERAKNFYRRGQNYGLRILNQKKSFRQALDRDLELFRQALRDFSRKDVPALFWTANAWGNWINLSKTEPQALAELPKVTAIMQRVIELDEGFFYGGAHLFLGTVLASRSRLLGGDPEKAQYHFQRAIKLSKGRFLLTKVFYAKYYAVQVQNRKLFENLLKQVLQTPDNILPEQRLANAVAKRKAAVLLQKIDDLFL